MHSRQTIHVPSGSAACHVQPTPLHTVQRSFSGMWRSVCVIAVRLQAIVTQALLPTFSAYTAGMSRIQYTVRGVPEDLDSQLRREARASGKTLNALVLETLSEAKLPASQTIHDDLDWFLGSGPRSDHEFSAAQEWLEKLPSDLA